MTSPLGPHPGSLDFHLSPAGLSAEVIDDLLQQGGISARNYRGIFAATELPAVDPNKLLLPRRKERIRPNKIIIIVNVGRHWTAVCLNRPRRGQTRGYAIYADPYGLPPMRDDVRDFMKRAGTAVNGEWYYNQQRVQAVDSNYCGLFAALWALRWDKQREGKSRKLKFFKLKHRLRENDKLCIVFLRRELEDN